MPWYAAVDSVTGELLSTGSSAPDPVPAGVEIVEIDRQLDFDTERWDPATRSVVAAPVVQPPDVAGFYSALIADWGGTTAGYAELERIDLKHPGIDDAIAREAWALALLGIERALSSGTITQAQYDQIQARWDEFRLGRPA